MKWFLVAACLLGALFLGACSWITRPGEQPILTDYQTGEYSIFKPKRDFGSTSLTASRRMVLFKLRDKDFLRVCAEPPPTVGEELNKALQAALNATIDRGTANKNFEAAGHVASSLGTSLVKLEKAKGIQYGQDSLYSICQMYLNSAINSKQTEALISEVLSRSERILLAEIAAKSSTQLENAEAVTPNKRILDTHTMKLQVSEPEILQAFHGVTLYARKATENQSSTDGWMAMGVPRIIAPDTLVLEWSNPNTVFKDADLIEAQLRIEPREGADIRKIPVQGTPVYYTAGGDQVKVVEPKLNEKKKRLDMNVLLPSQYDAAFAGFDPQVVPVEARIHLDSPKSILSFVTLDDRESTQGRVSFDLPDSVFDALQTILKDRAVAIDLTFVKSVTEAPLFAEPVHLAQISKEAE